MKTLPDMISWREKHRRDYDALLVDIDGTLLWDGAPCTGAREFVDYLSDGGIPFLATTNDAVHSPEEKSAALKNAGMDIPPEKIVSAGDAAAEFVRIRNCRRIAVSGEFNHAAFLPETVKTSVPEARGLWLVNRGMVNFDDEIGRIIEWLTSFPENAVLFINDDLLRWNGKKHVPSAGCCRIVLERILMTLRLNNPLYSAGKPYGIFWECCRGRLQSQYHGNFPPERLVSCGDSLESDVRGAAEYGLCGIQIGEKHV